MTEQTSPESTEPKMNRYQKFGKQIRNDFFYGLFLSLPLIATVLIILFCIDLIASPITAVFGQTLPAPVSILISFILITAVGMATRNFIGKAILNYIEELIQKIPFVNSIYKSAKQITQAFSFHNKGFLSVAMVEFPRKGLWSIGFLTKEVASGLRDIYGNELSKNKCAIFVPTTPNPTTGFFFFVDKSEVIILDIPLDSCIRMIMSAGVIAPNDPIIKP